jgi:hypothetical protein
LRGIPTARTALWQVVQVWGGTAAWSKRAGIQAFVVWQVSQVLLLAMCLTGFARAMLPLWQL